jgi:hypothetical protein
MRARPTSCLLRRALNPAQSRYFDYVQAAKLVGRRIRTKIAWSGIPAGTTGRIVRADNSYTESGRLALVIRWDLPERSKPLEDWFDANEFQHLEVIP